MKPFVAIIGRANVGKSRLFNRLTGKSQAIVHDQPGITRDRLYAPCFWAGREFILIDSGGVDLEASSTLDQAVTEQSLMALEEADLIIALFDGTTEPTSTDYELMKRLRNTKKPVLFTMNKIDTDRNEPHVASYYQFGLTSLLLVSAEHGRGIGELLDEVVEKLPKLPEEEEKNKNEPHVAIIGRPNVGKSTLINRFVGEKRVLVHETPGTTRDAIDVAVTYDEKPYLFVDTAGVSKHKLDVYYLEGITTMRTLRTVDRCHIAVLMIDANIGLTHRDRNLADYVFDQGKGLLLAVNKSDLLEKNWEEYIESLRDLLGELRDIPILRLSAKTGQGCLKIFPGIQELYKALGSKLSTSELNKLLERALSEHHLPAYRGKSIRIYYGTQMGTFPPRFVFFSNAPQGIATSYRRYLTKAIKTTLGIRGIPLRLQFRKKT